MIMRQGEVLLLPANPLFIGVTLLLALAVNLLPLGRSPAMPDLLALVVVFWSVHQPRRVGIFLSFGFGLVMDVHQGALLGHQVSPTGRRHRQLLQGSGQGLAPFPGAAAL